ncbi:hypothetical protein FALBO_4974 [Fusarium albosuccineum]|uniref:Uncharacterized protein n=2 Tax=Fusarium decemcellulare species complex TaxID=1329916 RepID=A0A8H4LG42_9HYPO|nr:hypothetical protein FALBO_4974 [Fusarium albosuccineum]KAF4985674.1 hypothetical protein FDECE_16397 [Fusarium decemcellulare]KAJ3524861.1 hypothetical protein NM208_g11885 [Fusarium decemcellulare]
MKKPQLNTSSITVGARFMTCTRGHIVIGAIIFMVMMSSLLWKQQEFVGVKLPALEAHLPSLLGPGEGTNHTKVRFWTTEEDHARELSDWRRPAEIKKIMGLVFYGRRHSVSILDCYLKRNLVKNGGVLDGVIFVERTRDVEDLSLLSKLLASEEAYEKWHIEMTDEDNFTSGFASSYDLIEDDVMYVKIDDDIVFMEDSVIPSIVKKKIEHPEYYVISANVVNQPLLSWVHWNLGAVKPYLPEVNSKGEIKSFNIVNSKKYDWHVSTLPAWHGPSEFSLDEWEADDKHHRWLPLKGRADHILDRTPIETTEYHPMGRGWTEWKIGAQEHYSLFENLESNRLSQYKFDTWDFQFERMGIQFIAMLGKDINIAKPIAADDEDHFSCEMPRRLGRHAVTDGRGIAAHYSFGSQRGGMDRTDILARYRAFARDHICASPMLWRPGDS